MSPRINRASAPRPFWGGLRGALVVLALVGCVPAPGAPDPETSQRIPGLGLQPAPGGLEVIGSGGREIGFGRDAPGALHSMARVTGRVPESLSCNTPGMTAYSLGDGLVVSFAGGAFVGWKAAGASAGRVCA